MLELHCDVQASGRKGLGLLLKHVTALDSQALARIRAVAGSTEGISDIYLTTPFATLVSRRAAVSPDGVVGAMELKNFLNSCGTTVECEEQLWIEGLPPQQGFELLQEFPARVVSYLGDKGKEVARQFSGPLGPPASLLNQSVISVDGGHHVPMRMVFSAQNCGFIPGPAVPDSVPRLMRLSRAQSWLRLDSPFGSVYYREG